MKSDTSPEAAAQYLALLRAQTPAQRFATIVALTGGVRKMAEAGIRQSHPGASEDEIRPRLAVRLYGRELVERHFGPVPQDAR